MRFFILFIAYSTAYRQFVQSEKMDILRHFQNISWCKPDWCYPSMSKETNELLHQCIDLPTMKLSEDVEELIKKSKAFPIPFPIETVRLEKLRVHKSIEKLKRNIMSTYPLIHERVLLLMTHFLIYKREFGSNIEKAFYKDMTVPEFIERILKKRAVTFMNESDEFLLLSGERDHDGWEQVGTLHQKPPLLLENCLSYDEMKLSAMVYVSGYTECINDGSRTNAGVIREDIAEEDAIIIGLIGPRFERRGRMDYEDILITEQQNCLENGYGEEVTPTTCLNVLKTTYVRNNQSAKHMWRQMWSEFYQVHSYTYEELTSYINIQDKDEDKQYLDRYVKQPHSDNIFDNEVYYKRLSILVETTLLEAEYRAVESGRDAFINVVGCGLGVWKIAPHQPDVYILTFLERIRAFLKKDLLNHVTDVNFAYIRTSRGIQSLFTNSPVHNDQSPIEKRIFFECKRHPKGGINVQMENREPSAKLKGEHEGKLLVMTYPWDSNAHPGNEFWIGSLSGSGDPAAACSTQVAELHNAHVNRAVSGYNVRVAGRYGVNSLAEFKPNWPFPNVTVETKEFLSESAYSAPANLIEDLDEIIKKSKDFPIQFPIDTMRLRQLILRRPIERLKRNIVSTYPFIHERVLILIIHFLKYKKECGSNIEKDFYKEMTVPQFIERILTKRAISFYGPRDKYLLLTGEKGMSGWELIGSSEQKPPLILENCLSYDELKISAMVYVSGYTDCINDGTRKNSGVVKEDDIEQNAVMIGLIGPRLKRRSKMDYEEILVTKEQNVEDHGYGDTANKPHQVSKRMWRKMWCEFYGIENVTYEKVRSLLQKQNRNETRPYFERYHHKKTSKLIFDNEVYYKRISVLAESTLLEAEHRAVESGKLAFVNVVGCGLGVWMVQPHQVDVYVLTFLDRIYSLLHSGLLNHVSDVNFAYIKASPEIAGIFTKDTAHKEPELLKLFLEYKGHLKGGINVQMQIREPSSKLTGEHEGKLLVMTYPWDSNAHPGNEFWCGLLASTGDSAAASSTQITELHNAYINPAVNATNVRVVGRHGLKTLADYCRALTTSD